MKSLGVVIPIFNTKTYLKKCVESVLEQKTEGLFVVLVDDGSYDGSSQICDEYELLDSRVHVIHQENKGKIEARYIGAAHLQTDYITFVDSDDWIEHNTYDSLREYMEKKIDVISYKIIRYINDDYQLKSEGKTKEGVFIGESYKSKICSSMIWDSEINSCGVDPSLCNKLFRREVLMPNLERARQIRVEYGDDAAVIFPTLYMANSYAVVDEYKYYHRRRLEDRIPEYILEDDYFSKLTRLYEYLRNTFNNLPEYICQLDIFFSYSAALRLRKYGIENQISRYIVPFEQITPNCRVLLYGAGKVGREYYRQIKELNFCKIVAWVDKCKQERNGVKISGCETINNEEYDYILIALKSEETVNGIIRMLVNEYNVDKNKIVWEFHEYFE